MSQLWPSSLMHICVRSKMINAECYKVCSHRPKRRHKTITLSAVLFQWLVNPPNEGLVKSFGVSLFLAGWSWVLDLHLAQVKHTNLMFSSETHAWLSRVYDCIKHFVMTVFTKTQGGFRSIVFIISLTFHLTNNAPGNRCGASFRTWYLFVCCNIDKGRQ